MKYLGITQKTANWFLLHPAYLHHLKKEFVNVLENKSLSDGVIIVGPLRVTALNNQLVCVWNNDYITGTGYEDWGFIKLDEMLGLLNVQDIFQEVLERELFIINQRLQERLLPEQMMHRSRKGNIHTCISGRGEIARHYSIGWYEEKVKTSKGSSHSIVCVGPSNFSGFDIIEHHAQAAGQLLSSLVENANFLLLKSQTRPALDANVFIHLKDRFNAEILKKGLEDLPVEDLPQLDTDFIKDDIRYVTHTHTYADWLDTKSSLSKTQREILESDVILKQPLRIIGAAGTGKSLLMQLLAIKRVLEAEANNQEIKVLYVVHNAEMNKTTHSKFEALGAQRFLLPSSKQTLEIKTLFEHCCSELQLLSETIVDKDAQQTKLFQRYLVEECIDNVFRDNLDTAYNSDLFNRVMKSNELKDSFAELIVSEIGIAIKGRGISDPKQYIEAERPLTRFHGILNQEERSLVFKIFEQYKRNIVEEHQLLDADDIAITYLAHLRTPLWEMKRKKIGYDFVFVDETQLFNQNERMLFRFLPRISDEKSHLPIVLALDEAQELKGASSAGFGLLGIEDIADETLPNVYRCTKDILSLAFFVISRTTDLFGPNFPDFTQRTSSSITDHNIADAKPKLIVRKGTASLGKSVAKEIRSLRKKNVRQIAVIINAERYWTEVYGSLSRENFPLIIGTKRGELIDPKKPIIYMTKPEYIGGQEFDAVICIGLEQGVIPLIINGHAGLSEALEQQALREIYLSFTRAKNHLIVLNSPNSAPTPILQEAISKGLINDESI